jgi:heptosyltransferase II
LTFEQRFKRSLASLFRIFLRSRISPPPSPDRVKSILIVRQHNQLGDMLCVVPLLRALRQRYPDAYLALMASPVNVDVMRCNRYLDEVILYDKREYLEHGRIHLISLIKFVRRLRARKFTVALVPSTVSTSFTSDLLAYLSGAQCRIGAGTLSGHPNKSAFLFTVPVDLDWKSTPDRHQTLRNIDSAANLDLGRPSVLSLEITLSAEEENAGRALVEQVKKGRRYAIGYHPGAGKPPNRWPSNRFASLISTLSKELDAAAIVTCGPMDLDVVKEVESGLEESLYLLTGQPIRRVASVLKSVDLVVTNDTGIMHVAAAVGVPVLSLFGPTSPEQWAPQGEHHRYIVGENGDIRTIQLEKVVENARSMICC